MKLNVTQWGDGNRTAVLVHGLSGSSQGWSLLAPDLVERGYRVLAPDLRGHGAGPRGPYVFEEWTEDLLESLPAAPDVVISLSMGGVLAALLQDRLRARRAIYIEPVWYQPDPEIPADLDGFRALKELDASDLASISPHWSGTQVRLRLGELADWDPETTRMPYAAPAYVPSTPSVPSLVVLAEKSVAVTPDHAQDLVAAGFVVRTVVGAGHLVHFDDAAGCLAAMEDWL